MIFVCILYAEPKWLVWGVGETEPGLWALQPLFAQLWLTSVWSKVVYTQNTVCMEDQQGSEETE